MIPERHWIERGLGLAAFASTFSKDPKRKVGAAVVSQDFRQFSIGYNGLPKGIEDTRERLDDHRQRIDLSVHAELNALLNCPTDCEGWLLFATKYPCHECAKAIIQKGVVAVFCPIYRLDSTWVKSHQLAERLFIERGIWVDTCSQTRMNRMQERMTP